MKIIPAGLDAERQGRLVFIRNCLAAWRYYRRTKQPLRAATARNTVHFAIAEERSIRVQRLRDRLLRDIRDPQEVLP